MFTVTRSRMKILLPSVLVCLLAVAAPAWSGGGAAAENGQVRAILQMVDYVGVEYPEFVRDGRVLDEAEYAEQVEFALLIRERLEGLPDRAGKREAIELARRLDRAIGNKAPGEEVTGLIADLRGSVLETYPIAVAPQRPPEVADAGALYQQECAGCHGATGGGDGPMAAGMEPPPVNFRARERANQQSVFGLYNTITLGVDGTTMPGFPNLSEAERWRLAFYVGQLAYSEEEKQAGAAIWRKNPDARRAVPDLGALSRLSGEALKARLGEEAAPVLAYLRHRPAAVAGSDPARHLDTTTALLTQSLAAYRGGKPKQAEQKALSAYLDGFELAEPALAAADRHLMRDIEAQMQDYRNLLRKGAPVAQAGAQVERIKASLDEASGRLRGGGLSAWASFAGSFLILSREGLEAILVLAAIFAFLNKSGRREALPYAHGGWIAALLLGIGTWFAATYFIDISGASREVTEGVVALAAAAILLYVGLWLHNKSHADRWRQFVAGKLEGALAGRGLWTLAILAFLAVYREMFEIVLFYQALWLQGDHAALIGGAVAGAVVLVFVSWAIFYFSLKLPIGQFFGWSSVFIAALAVIFAGKGVAALQEAGTLPIDSIAFIQLPLLGIYSNLQALLLQMLVLGLVIVGFAYNRLTAGRAAG